jgi:hypothetical protein
MKWLMTSAAVALLALLALQSSARADDFQLVRANRYVAGPNRPIPYRVPLPDPPPFEVQARLSRLNPAVRIALNPQPLPPRQQIRPAR